MGHTIVKGAGSANSGEEVAWQVLDVNSIGVNSDERFGVCLRVNFNEVNSKEEGEESKVEVELEVGELEEDEEDLDEEEHVEELEEPPVGRASGCTRMVPPPVGRASSHRVPPPIGRASLALLSALPLNAGAQQAQGASSRLNPRYEGIRSLNCSSI